MTDTEKRIAEIKEFLADGDSGYYPLRKEQCQGLLSQLEATREALKGTSANDSHTCWCWGDDHEPHADFCLAARKALGIGEMK